MATGVNLSLMGPVTIGAVGKPGTGIHLGSRASVAFAYLVLERSRSVGKDELAEVVWGPGVPQTWGAALRGIVLRIRVALATAGLDVAEALTTGPGGYKLNLPAGAVVDIEDGFAALEEARGVLADDPRRALLLARRAIERSRGEFLSGCSGMWVERRQAELGELHVEALEVFSRAAASCDDGPAATWAAEEAVALRPLRESAYRCVMAGQVASGNRAEALRAYSRCRHVLVEELGVGPSVETESAYVALLGDAGPSRDHGGARRATPGNLPVPVTSFVGRERERAELKALIGPSRLVTLTGMGGAGKSRLGLEVARELSADRLDCVWLVELTGVADNAFVAEHVLSVLEGETQGRSPTDSLICHLTGRTTLLLLDNCEHVVEGCASLCDALLSACPGLHILATSRQPLLASGETTWAVAPLATPGDEDNQFGSPWLDYESIRLFVDRARAAFPDFAFESVSDATVEICRRLDGIPLAIELAAARTRHMAAPEIARHLTDRFGLLVGGPRNGPHRHRTLRRALDWSFDSLSEWEKDVFARLSVFGGGFTLESAEAVCGETDSVFESISGLVDKSIVMSDRSGKITRFRLLETMRAFGQEKLAAGGCEVATRLAQVRWAVGLAESSESALDGPDQALTLELLDTEHDNLRGVLDWAASHEALTPALRVAACLWRYWEVRGFLGEGRFRLEALLRAETTPTALRAKALNAAGVLAQNQLDNASARSFYQEALDIRRNLGDSLGVAAALNGLGGVAVGEGDLLNAEILFEENLETSRRIPDRRLIAASLMNLGVVLQLLSIEAKAESCDRALRARSLYEESLHHYRQLGDRHGEALALENLGALAPYLGDCGAARAFLEESLALRRELGDKSGIAASARFLGHLALRDRDYAAARRLHEESLAIESQLENHLLMANDFASLAEVAAGEGDHATAHAMRRRALDLFGEVDDDSGTQKMRDAMMSSPPVIP